MVDSGTQQCAGGDREDRLHGLRARVSTCVGHGGYRLPHQFRGRPRKTGSPASPPLLTAGGGTTSTLETPRNQRHLPTSSAGSCLMTCFLRCGRPRPQTQGAPSYTAKSYDNQAPSKCLTNAARKTRWTNHATAGCVDTRNILT